MVTLTGWWRRLRPGRKASDKRVRALEVTPLERREMLTITGGLTTVAVHPGVLPPNGKYLPVAVSGFVVSTHTTAPKGFFFVTDAYRTDEPHGKVTLSTNPVKSIKIGATTWYYYSYSFNIKLQAKRGPNSTDGRHYDLFVGGVDAEGADGRTVAILVPKVYNPPTAKAAK